MIQSKLSPCILFAAFISVSAFANTPVIYPSKGQSPAQQSKDQGECATWAQQQVGYSPEQLLQTSQSSTVQAPPPGGAVRGGARGAVGGAAIGAIAGDAGKGAAIGAAAGGMAGGARQRQAHAQAQQMNQQNQAATQQALAKYQNAVAACLEGRGYTVK